MAMPSTSSADYEQARLEALRRYAILDTGAEPEFDELVRRAMEIFGAPAGALTLVDRDRCWFKARVGLDAPQLPRDVSFCGHAFRSSGITVVPDALVDDRFKRVPLVTAAGFRFYAGAPLITPDGFSLGTLCVLDRIPHEPDARQLAGLRELAGRVMALLDARLRDFAPAPPVALAPPRRTVLVVDDEALIREFVRQLLNRRGVASIDAVNGLEALALFRKHAADVGLVLTDIHMPQMNGLELIRALQHEPNPPAVAVMSGRLDLSVRADLAANGIRCVLPKPFPIEEFDALFALLPA